MTAAAAALLLGPAARPALAEGGIRLTLNGQEAARIPLGELRSAVDVPATEFTRNDGSATNQVRSGGVSAAALARIAGVDPAHVRTLAVKQVNGTGSVELSGGEVRDGFDGDPLGHRVAVFDPSYGPEVHFFRPMRNGSDVNAGDIVDAPRMTDLPVTITTDGATLTVQASASGERAERRTPVHFTVRVTGAAAGTALQVRWDFDDGTPSQVVPLTRATGATNHTFGANGLYRATATVTGADGSSGVGRAQAVRIGKAAGGGAERHGGDGGGGRKPGSGGGNAQPESRSTGPSESGGNGGGQALTGAQTPAPGPATPAPAASVPAPAATPQPGKQQQSGAKPRTRRQSPPAAAGGEPISGIVLASQSVPLDDQQLDQLLKQPQSESRAPLRRSAAPANSALGVVAGVGVLLALLLAGALLESGMLRRSRVRVA